jgi:hypothetical protein
MNASKPTEKRPYQRSGLYAVQNTLKAIGDQENWIDSFGEVGVELKAFQSAIIADMGRDENISAMERSIIDLATKTFLMLQSVDRFLLGQPSLVNKSKRQLFPVVLQRQTLADALARYMAQLGLKRRAKPTQSLGELLANGTSAEQN